MVRDPAPVTLVHQPNATRYPWKIKQGHVEVKLTNTQLMQLITDAMGEWGSHG